jgi:tRNA(fMet)-specific endonuclease VapC
LILDSDIIVWVLRGHPRAIALVDPLPPAERNVSTISYMELLRGCRDKPDMQRTVKLFEDELGEIVPLDDRVTGIAVELMERHGLSRRPTIPDILIAATALARGDVLATGNLKHFDYIAGLRLKRFVA